MGRDHIFAWLYKGQTDNISHVLEKICRNMILYTIKNNFIGQAQKQWNLLFSLKEYFKGEKKMAEIYKQIRETLRIKINQKEAESIDSDEEYFYAVGQIVRYFISLNKSKEKMHSLANPFFHVKNDKILKEKLRQFFMKYNYQLSVNGKRFNQLYSMICTYQPDGEMDHDIVIAGYLSSSLIYESDKEEEKNEYE